MDLVTEYLLDTGPSLLFLLCLALLVLFLYVYLFLIISCLFFLGNYLWDLFEVYGEGLFLWQSLVNPSAGCLRVLPDWWITRFLGDGVLDPCGYVIWARKPREACASGNSSSGMGYLLLCLVSRQLSWE